MKKFCRKFYTRQAASPFESIIGFFCIYGGGAGLLKYGIVLTVYTTAVSPLFLTIFNIVYLIAGLAIFLGLGICRGDLEAFGLILLVTILVVRSILYGIIFGADPVIINSYILNAVFTLGSIIRLRTIFRNNRLIENNDGNVKLIPL